MKVKEHTCRKRICTQLHRKGALIVQPAMEHRKQGIQGTVESSLPDLPDVSQPPPLIQHVYNNKSQNLLDEAGNATTTRETEILESIRDIIKVMENQIKLSNRNTEEGVIPNATLLQQFIKSQQERALDPALMAIPTFTGNDRTKCLDWGSRVKNICKQSGQSFHQELINKSELLVQNYIMSLSNNLSDSELIEKILRFFSDVPTSSHALEKLKQIQQSVDEPIISYNQRYKNLLEWVEGSPLSEIMSAAAMEMYLCSINIHIRKSICNTLFWNSRHAPKKIEEAMTKAQELYIKHLYSTGEDRLMDVADTESNGSPAITVEEVQPERRQRWGQRKAGEGDKHLTPSTGNYPRSNGNGRNDRPLTQKYDTSQQGNCGDEHLTPSGRQKAEGNGVQLWNAIRSAYTQIMVNPMQLQDHEFTAWLERLVEARKNRQENKARPYRNYHKPCKQDGTAREGGWRKPQLCNKMMPAQELDVQQIMDTYKCQYNDVIKAVDMYNLDVEECHSA